MLGCGINLPLQHLSELVTSLGTCSGVLIRPLGSGTVTVALIGVMWNLLNCVIAYQILDISCLPNCHDGRAPGPPPPGRTVVHGLITAFCNPLTDG